MENKTSYTESTKRLNKKLFNSLYDKVEELRKENEGLKQERFIESQRILKDEAEIERLEESNKELVEALTAIQTLLHAPPRSLFGEKIYDICCKVLKSNSHS